MSEQQDVKVFISWSGDFAKEIAVALRAWLPLLFDRIQPWASDTDIAPGQRNLAQIEAELAHTRFGIVVVTAENQNAPWLNFEAGALSRVVDRDLENRVVPLLVDLTSPSQLTGPLAQFQGKILDKSGVRAVVRTLAALTGINESVADERLDAYWPRLETEIREARERAESSKSQQATPRSSVDMLEEILLHVRLLRQRQFAGEPRLPSKPLAFHRWLDELSAKHGFKVDRYPDSRGSETRQAYMSAMDKYSEEAEEAFRAEFLKRARPEDQDVSFAILPF